MEALCRIRDIFRLINDFESEFQIKYGICMNEGMLLCTLMKQGQCTSGKLAEMLGLTLSNTSKVIASVEKKGLLERKLGKEDKRQMHFVITDMGIECMEFIKNNSDDVLGIIAKVKEM